MTAEELAEALKPELKKLGYKKSRLNWWKPNPELIRVLNIQKSQWSDDYYINLGIYITALGTEDKPPHNRCHIRARANANHQPNEVLNETEAWFEKHGSIAALAELAKQNQLPPSSNVKAKEYLGHNQGMDLTVAGDG